MKRRKLRLIWLSSACLMAGLFACDQTAEIPDDVRAATHLLPDQVDYNLHVKPILSDRCFACHGPDKAKQQAGLRLDTPQGAYEALTKSGHTAIVPGKAAKSELVQRILSTDAEEQMPTPKSNLVLSAGEKALLVRWVEQGAGYKPHWSLIAPTVPEVPKVQDEQWVRNEIDRFILAKQADKKLTHAPEADKATLLRRVTLDLTGLPPTPAEVDGFLADSSPKAYEKVVNRLLSSPHYGEHMATAWLDIARYADTHGYQLDVMRTAWPYRDWVIRAFNRNLSFDRFITWQLAGDLLPNTTRDHREQLIATAFNRMHPQNQEGGIVEEEYLAEYAADRTATFGKAMLGLTVECARCHDHKYDPIPQKEYYGLFAFFNTINEAGQVPYYGESSPTLILTDRRAEEQLRFIQTKIRRTEAELKAVLSKKTRLGNSHVPNYAASGRLGPVGSYSFDDTTRLKFTNAADLKHPATISGDLDNVPKVVPGRFGRGRAVDGDGTINLGREIGFFERHEPFSVSLWIKLLKPGLHGPVFSRSNGQDNGNRGYECLLQKDGTLSFQLNHNYPDNSIDLHTVGKLPVGQWVHLAVTYDGSGTADGTRIYLNGRPVPVRVYADNLKKSIIYGANRTNGFGFGLVFNFMVGAKFRDAMSDFWVDQLNVFDRAILPDEVALLTKYPRLPTVQNSVTDGVTARLQNTLCELRQQETTLYDAQPEVMIMKERRYVRPTYLLRRGAYDAPGERVEPNTLTALGSLPDSLPRNRLGLAKWLLLPENPLFARVAVNRFWQQLFGQGLVKSSDDFGNQGSLPSHPELLDYLAVRFRNGWPLPGTGQPGSAMSANRWNVKALMRDMVLSATYRQSSVADARAREADPDNTYLSRGPSYRLSAEQVRDGALAAAGLLNRRIGGPSVYPYQPGGIWETLNQNTRYRQSDGDSLYRRSMYTIWKRTAPPPMMLNFDAAERHFCTVKRQKTSTPLQALVTLNDPQFVEAARVLAQRVVDRTDDSAPVSGKRKDGETNVTVSRRPPAGHEQVIIQRIVKAILSRPARPVEVNLLEKLYADEVSSFKQEPKRAHLLLKIGEHPLVTTLTATELAAWTVVVSTVLNMDEALIKR